MNVGIDCKPLDEGGCYEKRKSDLLGQTRVSVFEHGYWGKSI
jgi:hypothetical protein